jgi:hypothetical protein
MWWTIYRLPADTPLSNVRHCLRVHFLLYHSLWPNRLEICTGQRLLWLETMKNEPYLSHVVLVLINMFSQRVPLHEKKGPRATLVILVAFVATALANLETAYVVMD